MPYVDRTKTRPGTTRRIRMDGHDYSSPGYYFITMCAFERQPLFGHIADDAMTLSPAGGMVSQLILESGLRFPTVIIDCRVVMPNQVHILIGMNMNMSDQRNLNSVSDVVKWFKSASISRYGLGVKSMDWPRYRGKLWHQGFHDHIIRNDRELETLRNYVGNNVYMWQKDKFYDG